MFIFQKRNQRGFTLIELMVVVVIIGVLAAVAIPNFLRYQAKSKQSEARNNLGHVFTLETSYFGERNTYHTLAGIGWRAPVGEDRYQYTVIGWSANSFTAQATSNIDADVTIDLWQINQRKDLTNPMNDVLN